jgi:hypothetical protein
MESANERPHTDSKSGNVPRVCWTTGQRKQLTGLGLRPKTISIQSGESGPAECLHHECQTALSRQLQSVVCPHRRVQPQKAQRSESESAGLEALQTATSKRDVMSDKSGRHTLMGSTTDERLELTNLLVSIFG